MPEFVIDISELRHLEKPYCVICGKRMDFHHGDAVRTVTGREIRKDNQPMEDHFEHRDKNPGCVEPKPIKRCRVLR